MPLANRNDSLVMTWRERWKGLCGTNKFFTAEDNTLAVSHERLAIQQHVQQDVRVEKDSHLASLVQTMLHRIVVHPHIIGCEPHTAPRAPHPFASLARSSLLDRVYRADLNQKRGLLEREDVQSIAFMHIQSAQFLRRNRFDRHHGGRLEVASCLAKSFSRRQRVARLIAIRYRRTARGGLSWSCFRSSFIKPICPVPFGFLPSRTPVENPATGGGDSEPTPSNYSPRRAPTGQAFRLLAN